MKVQERVTLNQTFQNAVSIRQDFHEAVMELVRILGEIRTAEARIALEVQMSKKPEVWRDVAGITEDVGRQLKEVLRGIGLEVVPDKEEIIEEEQQMLQ